MGLGDPLASFVQVLLPLEGCQLPALNRRMLQALRMHRPGMRLGEARRSVEALKAVEKNRCFTIHAVALCRFVLEVQGLAWRSLQELDISGCCWLTSLAGVARSARKLRSLDLSFCDQILELSSLGVCSELQSIRARCCSRLYDVEGLSQAVALLRLDVSMCPSLRRVAALAESKSLSWVDLSRCFNVEDAKTLCRNQRLQLLPP